MGGGKGIWIGILAVVAAGVVLYFIGAWQGKQEILGQKEAVERQLHEAQARLAVSENAVRLFKARIALGQTALELDRRNFGNAQSRLQEAAVALEGVDPAAAGLDKTAFAVFRQEVGAASIVVATDLEGQRRAIQSLEKRLDDLLPGRTPPAPPPAGR